ncbi:DegT/DnrJ/EryC1/StrS aminotransferase family protein [Amylibacter sp.]|nr:DegT/DnrJ/EryC1/StrS aminotransferase family protein [Amylibacter sp.]
MILKPFYVAIDDNQQNKLSFDLKKIISSGQFVLGEFTERLESEIRDWVDGIGVKVVSSGTVALECVFEYLKTIGKKHVGVQSNTNFATVSSIIRAGLTPIYIDCDEHGQICLSDLKLKYLKYDIDTVAMVHIGGYVSNKFNEIIKFCNEKDIKLIEDCAHAHGSKINNKPLGSFGFASIFSFFPTKLINGGEGGAICSGNSDLINFAHKWRNQGKDGTFGNSHFILGGSYRMPEMNCALALSYYGILPQEIEKRSNYVKHLKEISKYNYIKDPTEFMNECSFYKLILRFDSKLGSKIEEDLKEKNIFCGGAVYRTACHDQPVFIDHQLGADDLPNTKRFCKYHFCPPLHGGLKMEEIIFLANELDQVYENKS